MVVSFTSRLVKLVVQLVEHTGKSQVGHKLPSASDEPRAPHPPRLRPPAQVTPSQKRHPGTTITMHPLPLSFSLPVTHPFSHTDTPTTVWKQLTSGADRNKPQLSTTAALSRCNYLFQTAGEGRGRCLSWGGCEGSYQCIIMRVVISSVCSCC